MTDKQVGRTPIEHKMMDIHQEFDAAFGLHHFETVKGRLLKVKRTDELALVGGQFLVGHVCHGHFHGNVICQGLYNGITFCREMDAQFRMGLNHLFNGLCQPCGFNTGREAKQNRDIVNCRCRIADALEIHARLSIAQWIMDNG